MSFTNRLTPKKIGLIILLIIFFSCSWKGWHLGQPLWSLYQTATQVQALAAEPAQLNPTELPLLVNRTHLDLVNLQQEISPFSGLLQGLDWVPRLGGELAATPDLLAMGVSLTAIADIGLTTFEPLLPLLKAENRGEQSTTDILAQAINLLAVHQQDFEEAQQHLHTALTHRANIQTDTLSPRLAAQLKRFDQGLPFLELGLQFAPLAPTLLGAESPQTYLVIAQNDDELRATGGFISAVGRVTFRDGQLSDMSFEDSYAIDNFKKHYPPPPAALNRYMQAQIWLFRDANWSPDFPTTAQTALELYQITREGQVNGLIAVDQVALQKIVQALQPLTVSTWDEPVTGKNIISLIRQSWSTNSDDKGWWKNRKNFIGDLVAALRQRVETEPQNVDWLKFGQASLDILNQRHVQIWLTNPVAQQLIEDRGWAGTIRPTAGDYLFVVDTNIGFNKVNVVAQTNMLYEVNLVQPDSPQANLTLTHKNHSQGETPCLQNPHYGNTYQDLINRCYWNYVRVYTPLESQLLKATPHTIPAENLLLGRDEPARVVTLPPEKEKSVWSTLLLIPHGETRKTEFTYTLPPTILTQTEVGWHYHLTLQKQAGTTANPLKVVVTLPPNTTIITTSPAVSEQPAPNILVFNLQLKVDKEIDIVFDSLNPTS